MRTLEHMKAAKQRRIARETMDIYAPLADRLGMNAVKIELQDLSFRYLQPNSYAQMRQDVEEHLLRGPVCRRDHRRDHRRAFRENSSTFSTSMGAPSTCTRSS